MPGVVHWQPVLSPVQLQAVALAVTFNPHLNTKSHCSCGGLPGEGDGQMGSNGQIRDKGGPGPKDPAKTVLMVPESRTKIPTAILMVNLPEAL